MTMRWWAVVFVMAGLAGQQAASADTIGTDPDIEAAKRHFDQGRAFYEVRRYDEAMIEFEAAKVIKPLPALDYNIARCLDRLERYDEAAAAYQRYVDGAPNAEDVNEARDRIRVLQMRIAALAAIRGPGELSPPVASATQRLENHAASPEPRTSVTVLRTKEVPPAPASGEVRHRPPPWLSMAVGGLGVATLGAGAGIYGWATSDYSKLKSDCAPRCTTDESREVVRRGDVGVALMATGGALAAAGAAIAIWRVVTAPRPAADVAPGRRLTYALPGPGSFVVGGEF